MIQVHTNLEALPAFTNAVVTIGTFDGVHSGHRKIIDQLKQEAKAIAGETVIITFHPHPRKVVNTSGKEIKILNTLAEKTELLDNIGIEHLVVVPFNDSFANQSAEEYVNDFLVKKFNPKTIIIGYDHKFGKGRKGDYQLLEALGALHGFEVKEIPEHILNEATVSSTRIRAAIANADIATANENLGYPYFFEGKVIEGNKLGRTIGYPTANIQIQDAEKLIPGNGVYAVEVKIEGKNVLVNGMMNIGFRPTVDGKKMTIEVNLFDFDEDLYGKTIRVYVKHYLRGEQKFNGLDALKQQLAIDKQNALKALQA